MRKIIIVTGTPGTGKTNVAKFIARKLNAGYVDINDLIKKQKIYFSYDRKLKTYLVNPKRLIPVLRKIIKESKSNLVIDGHLSHYLSKKDATLCIVTKCNLKVLEKRLKKRKYSKEKIRENLDSERFDVCLVDAAAGKHMIRIIDTTKGIKKLNLDKLLK